MPSPKRMARGPWRSCCTWWWGRGGGTGSGGEGGQAAHGEDGLGRRRMVLGGGTADVVRMVWGRWRGERGEYQ
jgi:hypothetical protein